MFLQQVDDFAVVFSDKNICKELIHTIESSLTVPLHLLGTINKLNSVDISQTRDYIKTSCRTFLDKVLDNHGWQETIKQHNPIPMKDDSAY